MSDQETQVSSAGEDHSPKPNREERHERGGSGSSGGARDRGRRRHQPQPQRRPEATLNMGELRELVELIAQYGFTDFELEREGIRVRLRRELAPQIITQPPPVSAPAPPTSATTTTSASDSAHAAPKATASAGETGAESSTAATQEAEAADAEDAGLVIIPSPIVGTFYRSPSPTSEPFVRLGSRVDNDTVVCIIEAMKLMNEIQAETSGEIAKIYVENGQAVEYGQPLFGLKK
ncbi:MAG TPA: acetyl-CoA carboxylase biotin carboxyl carrier protein [Pyrinomonadaceae bacterium]|jgi:acetyl-CoA carboxylase biotin carboxyl carrier protein|nr:acetyl-CoA carboxylase biotin carboxyl carrier protein [Pyrinomonadaceae bacterium]